MRAWESHVHVIRYKRVCIVAELLAIGAPNPIPMRATTLVHLARRFTLLKVPFLRRKLTQKSKFLHILHSQVAFMSQTTTHPAAPRPSASLIIVNPRNEILLVHRNTNSTSYAGVHVCFICF